MSFAPGLDEIRSAAEVVYRAMPPTPQYSWPLLNARAGCELWVKHENHTPVGAFKVRGGLVYFDWLARERPEVKTVVSATTGNHGQSIAFAAARHGIRAVIVVPFGSSREKNASMRALGAELVEFGDDFQAAAEHAARLAETQGWHRVPSYHRLLVRGVATYALEFLSAAPELETLYVPVGMGSGMSGIVAVRDGLGLRTKIVGVVSSLAPAFELSFKAGMVVEHPSTTAIADGVASRRPDMAGVLIGLVGLERIISVDDDEVKQAMRMYFADTHNVAEGAGAIGLAALLKDKTRGAGRVGTVLTGGNVDSEIFARILAGPAL